MFCTFRINVDAAFGHVSTYAGQERHYNIPKSTDIIRETTTLKHGL